MSDHSAVRTRTVVFVYCPKRSLNVLTALNGVNLAGCICACSSFTKSTIMCREQTARRRSANFCVHMHVVMMRSPANFVRIVNVLDLYFQSQRFECIEN